MRKKITFLSRFLLAVAIVLTGILVIGNVRIKADETEAAGKIVRVKDTKELTSAINDPEVDTIYFSTSVKKDFTIKANKNAKNKLLIFNAPNASFENKAVFGEIQILSVCDYVEKTSGNIYVFFNPNQIHSFTVAKKKTVKGMLFITDSTFNELYNFYVLRKGAKVEIVRFVYESADGGEEAEFDESKNELSLKYTDPDGNPRSYTVKLDTRGRITKMISDATFNFDYNFKYNKNGQRIKVSGSDDDDGKFTIIWKYDGNYILSETFKGEVRTYEYKYLFKKGANYKCPLEVEYSSSSEFGEDYWLKTYVYDKKNRFISCFTDFGDYNLEMINVYNKNDFLVKETYQYYTPDGEKYEDCSVITYEYNDAGDMIKRTFTYDTEESSAVYLYDDYGNLIDVKNE